MNTHTPGPWIIGRGADGLPIIHTAPDRVSPSGQGIAHVCKRAMCQDHEANARLIAAAPRMRERIIARLAKCMIDMVANACVCEDCQTDRAILRDMEQ